MTKLMSRCPFCGGPPVAITVDAWKGGTINDPDPDHGALAQAYVFCHECGAQGPHTDDELVYEGGSNEKMEAEAIRLWDARFSVEPRGEVRTGDYVDVGGEPGLAVYPPHVLVLWQNKRTSLVPLSAVSKTSAAPIGIGSADVDEARKLGPSGSSVNLHAGSINDQGMHGVDWTARPEKGNL